MVARWTVVLGRHVVGHGARRTGCAARTLHIQARTQRGGKAYGGYVYGAQPLACVGGWAIGARRRMTSTHTALQHGHHAAQPVSPLSYTRAHAHAGRGGAKGEGGAKEGAGLTSAAALALGVAAVGVAYEHQTRDDKRAQCFSRKRNISDFYRIVEKPIGSGGFSLVFLAEHCETGEVYAVKQIPKKITNLEKVMAEIDIMRAAGEHAAILNCRDQFEDADNYYLIMTHCQGGELFDRLVEEGAYSELKASKTMREIAEAITYLHQQGIVHGDLKPENLLLVNKSKDAPIMLVDFGESFSGSSAVTTQTGEPRKDKGTVAYMSPEMVAGQAATQKSDMWALGIILYILLSGYHPFDPNLNADDDALRKRIAQEHDKYVVFDDNAWTHISSEAKDLLKRLLAADPDQRPTAHELMHHPWISALKPLSDEPLRASAENLRRLHRGRRWLKALMLAIMSGLGPSVGEGAVSAESLGSRKAAINVLDADEKGYVTKEDLARALEDLGEKDMSDQQLTEMLKSGDGNPNSDLSHITHHHLAQILPPLCPAGKFKKDEVIYSEGEVDRHFYLLQKGVIKFRFSGASGETPVEVLTAGASFGEVEMVVPSDGTVLPRAATCVCSSPQCDVIIVEDYLFSLLTDVFYSTHNRLRQQAQRRCRKRVVKWIETVSSGTNRSVKSGDDLLGFQPREHSLMMVKDGLLEVETSEEMFGKNGRVRVQDVVKHYGPGTFLYTQDARKVKCVEDATLVEVPASTYQELLKAPGKEAIMRFIMEVQEEHGNVKIVREKSRWLSWKGLFGSPAPRRFSNSPANVAGL